MKLFTIVTTFAALLATIPGTFATTLSDGKKVVCTHETYNCPRSRSTPSKNLETCEDVKLVWDECHRIKHRDVHGLDGDNDGVPCQNQCG